MKVGTAVTAIGLTVALAATMGPLPLPSGVAGASLMIQLPGAVRVTVIVLLALSALIVLALQRPQRRGEGEILPSRPSQRLPAWAQVLLSLPVLLPLVALLYFAWYRWNGGGPEGIDAPFDALSRFLDFLALSRKAPTTAPLFDLAVATVVVLIALAIFALVVLVALAERIAKWRAGADDDATPALHEAVTDSLGDLSTEPDARRAIIRAYRHFERALSLAHAPRAPWQTPSEFMRFAFARLPVPVRPVERLTALFEIARFSDRRLDTDARDSACACLDEIKTALECEVRRDEATKSPERRAER